MEQLVQYALAHTNWFAIVAATLAVFVTHAIVYTLVIPDLYIKLAHPHNYPKLKSNNKAIKEQLEREMNAHFPIAFVGSLLLTSLLAFGLWHTLRFVPLNSAYEGVVFATGVTVFILTPISAGRALWLPREQRTIGLLTLNFLDDWSGLVEIVLILRLFL